MWNTIGVHKEAAFWLLHSFMKHPVSAALGSCTHFAQHRTGVKKDGMVTSYCELINYLFETLATDDIISETDADTMCFT